MIQPASHCLLRRVERTRYESFGRPCKYLANAVVLFRFLLSTVAQPAIQVIQLISPQPWRRVEFRVQGIPAVSNPFDPDVIRVEGAMVIESPAMLADSATFFRARQSR